MKTSVVLLFSLVLVATILSAQSTLLCKTRVRPRHHCPFGVVKDVCGRDVCAKGPGHRCGGKWNHFGTCAEGLICSCNRCLGCSLINLDDCYSGPCIIN